MAAISGLFHYKHGMILSKFVVVYLDGKLVKYILKKVVECYILVKTVFTGERNRSDWL